MAHDDEAREGGWRDLAFRVAFGLERRVDAVRGRWRRRQGDAVVVPYLGFGAGATVRVRGRVLRDLPVDPADPGDGPFTNLSAAIRRFASAEVAHATVEVTVADGPNVHRVTADEEGFVDARIDVDTNLAPGRWPVRFRVIDPEPEEPEQHEGEVVVPDPAAPFAVISDIDDTVLVSDATRTLRVLARTLLQNVHERVPFAGVAALYGALASAGAPFFYVSSSPWNLHGPLTRFLDLNELPSGPLLLRDWGLDDGAHAGRGHGGHKLAAIEAVLASLPGQGVLLIGDSGQEDPEIYAQVLRDRPGRVVGVIIRDVSDGERDAEVDAIAQVAEAAGVPFRRVADSAEAAQLCWVHGWISSHDVAACEAAVRDAIPPTEPDAPRG